MTSNPFIEPNGQPIVYVREVAPEDLLLRPPRQGLGKRSQRLPLGGVRGEGRPRHRRRRSGRASRETRRTLLRAHLLLVRVSTSPPNPPSPSSFGGRGERVSRRGVFNCARIGISSKRAKPPAGAGPTRRETMAGATGSASHRSRLKVNPQRTLSGQRCGSLPVRMAKEPRALPNLLRC